MSSFVKLFFEQIFCVIIFIMNTLIKYRIVMELIRTIIPCILLILQCIILFKLFS